MTIRMQQISEADVRRSLDPTRLISALEAAFRDRYAHSIIPPRTHAKVADGIFLAMSCYDASANALGMKLVMVRERAPQNEFGATHDRSLRRGRIQATYLLLDPATAQPRALIAANYLTDLRTAATSAVATKFLARSDARTLGIFGTGRLARTHLAVLPLVRKFERVLVCGRSPSRSVEFVEQVQSECPALAISAADARACAAESDVVCTVTSASEPLFDGHDLRPGTHLNLVGSFQPQTREVDTFTVSRSRVVIDTYPAATEVGELVIPMSQGAISRDPVVGDLHELLSEKKQGRRTERDVTVFKSAGCALEDLVAAEVLLAGS